MRPGLHLCWGMNRINAYFTTLKTEHSSVGQRPIISRAPGMGYILEKTIPGAQKMLPMMKKIISVCLLLAFVLAGQAQRIIVVDTKYILDKMPEYKDAQKKLDQISLQWQKEIDDKQSALDKMYKDYDAEQVMLSDTLKKKREDLLFNREKEVRDLQRKRFGYEGDLFKMRQELVKPIQDKVYNAIQQIAVNRMYDLILDKSEGITVIFADPKLDKSEDILRALGIAK
jgi:outer membrane protein